MAWYTHFPGMTRRRSLVVEAAMDQYSRHQRDLAEEPGPLPLCAGPISNGEFIPAPQSTRDRAINAVIRSTIDTSARRLGVDRRRFLQGAGAVAAALAAFELAGCATTSTVRTSSLAGRHGRGGTFNAPPPEDT